MLSGGKDVFVAGEIKFTRDSAGILTKYNSNTDAGHFFRNEDLLFLHNDALEAFLDYWREFLIPAL